MKTLEIVKNVGIGIVALLGLALVGIIALTLFACGYSASGNCSF